MANSILSTSQPLLDGAEDSAQQLHLGFQRVQGAIEGVSVADLLPINLDVGGVVQTVLGAVPALLALRAPIVALGGFDPSDLDNLRDYALALGHTHRTKPLRGGSRDRLGLAGGYAAERLFRRAEGRIQVRKAGSRRTPAASAAESGL